MKLRMLTLVAALPLLAATNAGVPLDESDSTIQASKLGH